MSSNLSRYCINSLNIIKITFGGTIYATKHNVENR